MKVAVRLAVKELVETWEQLGEHPYYICFKILLIKRCFSLTLIDDSILN